LAKAEQDVGSWRDLAISEIVESKIGYIREIKSSRGIPQDVDGIFKSRNVRLNRAVILAKYSCLYLPNNVLKSLYLPPFFFFDCFFEFLPFCCEGIVDVGSFPFFFPFFCFPFPFFAF